MYDANPDRLPPLVGLGARSADSPAKVAERSEITFLSLPTPAVVEEVAGQWLAGAQPDAVLVDLSTNAPATVRALGARIAAAGRHLLEAPADRRRPGRAGAYAGLHGGRRHARSSIGCEPVLARLGRAVFHVGGLGLGNTAKLVNSLRRVHGHLRVARGAGGSRQGGDRSPHHGRGDPHRRRRQLLHRPHGRGHQRARASHHVRARAGGEGRGTALRPGARARRAGAGVGAGGAVAGGGGGGGARRPRLHRHRRR